MRTAIASSSPSEVPDPTPAIGKAAHWSIATIVIRRSVAACATLVVAAARSHEDGSGFNPLDLVVQSYSDDDPRQQWIAPVRETHPQVELHHDPLVSGAPN